MGRLSRKERGHTVRRAVDRPHPNQESNPEPVTASGANSRIPGVDHRRETLYYQ